MDDKKERQRLFKKTPQKQPQSLQTHNVPTDDVKNINKTN